MEKVKALFLVIFVLLALNLLYSQDNATHSWWCGDAAIGGYNNRWLQFITTDPIDLPVGPSGNLVLTFHSNYRVQGHAGTLVEGYDSWDGMNVRIVTGDDSLFEILEPIGGYPFNSMYGFGLHHEGTEIPGWGGSSDGWETVFFNLNGYIGETVRVRFAFGSTSSICTYDSSELFGWIIDDIFIRDDEDIYFFDGAGDFSQMTASNGRRAWGDYWEVSDLRGHSPGHSWRCTAGYPNLQDGLYSPIIDVPSTSDTLVFLEYWIYCDFADVDGDENGFLDDYMMVFVSPDNGATYYWLNGVCKSGMYDSDTFVVVNNDYRGNVVRGGSLYGMAEIPDTMRESGELRVFFIVYTDEIDEVDPGEGIFIDDFLLTKAPAINRDIVLYQICANPTNYDEDIRFIILLTNNGLESVTSIPLHYQIILHGEEGDSIVHTSIVSPFPSLTPGDSAKVTTSWSTIVPGDYTFLAYSGVTGDEVPENDTLRYRFHVYNRDTLELGFDDGEYNPFDDEGHVAYLIGPDLDGFDYGAVHFTAPFGNPLVTHVRWWSHQDYPVKIEILSSIDETPGDLLATDSCLTVTADSWITADIEDVELSEADFFVSISALRESTAFGLYADTSAPIDERSWLLSDPSLYNLDEVDFLLRAVVTRSSSMYAINPRPTDSQKRLMNISRGYDGLTGLVTAPLCRPLLEMDTIYFSDVEGSVTSWHTLDYTYSSSIPVYWHQDTFMHWTNIQDENKIPYCYFIRQNYPNPFNASTTIEYSLAENSQVRLEIFNLIGGRSSILVETYQSSGSYRVKWEGKNSDGQIVPAGIYFYKLTAGDFSETRQMIMLK